MKHARVGALMRVIGAFEVRGGSVFRQKKNAGIGWQTV